MKKEDNIHDRSSVSISYTHRPTIKVRSWSGYLKSQHIMTKSTTYLNKTNKGKPNYKTILFDNIFPYLMFWQRKSVIQVQQNYLLMRHNCKDNLQIISLLIYFYKVWMNNGIHLKKERTISKELILAMLDKYKWCWFEVIVIITISG